MVSANWRFSPPTAFSLWLGCSRSKLIVKNRENEKGFCLPPQFTIEGIPRKRGCLRYRVSRALLDVRLSQRWRTLPVSTKNTASAFLTLIEIWYCTFLCHCRIVVLWATVSLLHGPFSVLPFHDRLQIALHHQELRENDRVHRMIQEPTVLGDPHDLPSQKRNHGSIAAPTNVSDSCREACMEGSFFDAFVRLVSYSSAQSESVCVGFGGWTRQRSDLLGSRHESMAVSMKKGNNDRVNYNTVRWKTTGNDLYSFSFGTM